MTIASVGTLIACLLIVGFAVLFSINVDSIVEYMGQQNEIVVFMELDTPEEYMRDVYDEYVERRKFLIDGLNRIPGCYSPIPMGAFYTVARLPIDDADKFCAWCLEEFDYEGQTIFMAPASGFYTTPGLGKNEVRLAYVLKKEDLAKALVVLEKALETYNKKGKK